MELSDATLRDTRRPGTRSRLLSPIAAALAVVVVALGFVVAQLNDQMGQVEADAQRVGQILTASDVTVVALDAPAGTKASFTYSSAQRHGVFVVEGLAAVDSAMTYELWVISDGQPSPAGLFTPDDAGQAPQLVSADLGAADAIGAH